MNIIQIDAGSEAYAALQRAISNPDTYCIRIVPRADGIDVKVNGGMWTPTLTTRIPDSD